MGLGIKLTYAIWMGLDQEIMIIIKRWVNNHDYHQSSQKA
jgi:hypothetical protein